jgi:hypothetical protein
MPNWAVWTLIFLGAIGAPGFFALLATFATVCKAAFIDHQSWRECCEVFLDGIVGSVRVIAMLWGLCAAAFCFVIIFAWLLSG